jgi:hypothetical protein
VSGDFYNATIQQFCNGNLWTIPPTILRNTTVHLRASHCGATTTLYVEKTTSKGASRGGTSTHDKRFSFRKRHTLIVPSYVCRKPVFSQTRVALTSMSHALYFVASLRNCLNRIICTNVLQHNPSMICRTYNHKC